MNHLSFNCSFYTEVAIGRVANNSVYYELKPKTCIVSTRHSFVRVVFFVISGVSW